MAGKTVLIIGAGMAGLSTGCYAQMNGYNTQIFEHHSKPGGVVAGWKRQDYLIDGAIHYLWGCRPGESNHQLFKELGILQANEFIDAINYRFIDEPTGRSLDLSRDLEKLSADLKAISPADSCIVEDLIRGAKAMRDNDATGIGMKKPHELMGLFDNIKQIWDIRHILKYFGGKYIKPVSELTADVRDPWLRDIIGYIFLPDVPLWFACLTLGMYAGDQLVALEGGSREFAFSLEKHYKSLGGDVKYRSTVSEILVKDNKAIGVRLADGDEHFADIVVSAADGYNTIYRMLDGRFVDEKIENMYKNWKLFRPIVIVSYGIANDLKDEPCMSLLTLDEPINVGGSPVSQLFNRVFNYSPKFAPKGKSVFQVKFEASWEYWNSLRLRNQQEYNEEKQRIAADVLNRLEKHYPGIASQVEVIDVATPYTMWRYTRNQKGAFEGWLPTPEGLMSRIKKTLPGLTGFYMAGQWVMPGGGVPPCLYSGRQVVQLICAKDMKQFKTA